MSSRPLSRNARTAAIRGACASQSPRLRYKHLAEEAGFAVQTVRNVLADNTDWNDLPVIERLEAAVDSLCAPQPTDS